MTDDFKLNDGKIIPSLGLGTWMIADDKAATVVQEALTMGYRHVDTAQAYGNEFGVGKGVKASGIKREDIFITSKIAAEHKTYKAAAQSIDESLTKLDLDYLDLMLIHSPQPWAQWRVTDKTFNEGNLEVWRALEAAQVAGKVKSIGVSNFLVPDLENILEHSCVKPAVNQILAHVGNTPYDLITFCQQKGILVEAYSPIAHGQALQSQSIKDMAAKYGVSVAQVCILFVLKLGMVALPKTENPDHMRHNMALDFDLSEDDFAILKDLQFTDYGEYAHFPVFSGK